MDMTEALFREAVQKLTLKYELPYPSQDGDARIAAVTMLRFLDQAVETLKSNINANAAAQAVVRSDEIR